MYPINFITVLFHHQNFVYLQQGDKNLENVTHEEAVATLKATPERVVLIVGKPDQVYSPPPPPISTSPQLCKYYSFTKFICHKYNRASYIVKIQINSVFMISFNKISEQLKFTYKYIAIRRCNPGPGPGSKITLRFCDRNSQFRNARFLPSSVCLLLR